MALVAGLLMLGVWRQFTLLGPRGQLFDGLGLVPQWRFFAQSTLATHDDQLEDHHLLVRLSDGLGTARPWVQIFWDDERRLSEAAWNPQMRAKAGIHERILLATLCGETGSEEQFQSSLTYLTVLRYCLDHVETLGGEALQFAVATTAGREQRPLSVKFVSAWHTP